jgi:hypothetical protein
VGLDEANNNDNKKWFSLIIAVPRRVLLPLNHIGICREQCTLSINNIVGKGGRFANKFRKSLNRKFTDLKNNVVS